MKREFFLENGIYCKGKFDDFKLYYNNIILTPSCNDITYIPNMLIALKSERNIIVYKPKVIIVDDTPTLYELAKFEPKTPNVFLKIKMCDKTYIINSNLQVTLCNYIKPN